MPELALSLGSVKVQDQDPEREGMLFFRFAAVFFLGTAASMTVKTWQAESWISSAKIRAYHCLTSGVSDTVAGWKALVLWMAGGTMVIREGIAA